MKTNFDLERSKFNLACKAMLCLTVAMLCFNIASFSNSVKVYNNTECTMEVFCDEASLGTGVFYMGELQPGQRFTIYPTAIFGEVFCKNKRTGNYVKGIEFYYGHFDLYVNKGCSEDRPEENPSTPDNTAQCDDPAFAPCINTNVLDFSQDGIDWGLNDIGGSYTVGEQTFDISVNDADGIFAAYQAVQADSDDEGSYENNTGIAIGINPHTTDDVIEINYNLSLVSDYVAFTIRDLDKKYKENSQQIEEVCVFGYLDGVEILPTITSLCGSVKINGNCAVATTNSIYGEDESIRVVFETCINEIKIVYGNAVGAANNPTYSRIFIGDDIGFGTAVCTDDCKICTAEATAITLNSDSNEVVCTNSNTPINVEAVGGNGENSAWVITDQQTNIISTTDVPPFTFNEVGDYIIWFLNWDGDLSAVPAIGANAGDIVGASTCAILSNPIEINVVECCTAAAAVISVTGGAEMLDVCVNDEDLTTITFTLDEPGNGENSAWVITDENNIIKSVATDIPSLDLYGTDLGTMKIWYLNWDGDLSAAPNPGEDAAAIVTNSICAVLSNPVTIIKDCCCPYFIEFTEDNLNCDRGNLRIKPKLSVDPSLILDDGTLICNNNLDLISCSQNPTIFDSNDNIVSNPVTVAGDYSATIDCTCAPDVSFTLTQEKLDECNNAIPIVAPVLTVMDIADATATLTYVFDGPVTIEFRKDGDLAFEGFQSELGMAFLAGLEPCTSYDFRSKVDNGNDGVVISSVQTFTTTGCRNINIGNVNLRSLNVRATTAVLSWDNMPGCIYTFYYRVEGGNEWLNYNTSIPFVVLFGLNPCTNYEWALKISDENVESEISAAQLISTTCQGTRLSNPNATDIKIGNLTDLQNIELDLYLNPSAATLTIDYMGLPVNSASIYAANGQLVEALTISNNGLNTIDVNKLDAGVYILVSNLDAGLAKNKFVISK